MRIPGFSWFWFAMTGSCICAWYDGFWPVLWYSLVFG